MLAAKASLCVRVDALGEEEGPTIGLLSKALVEQRLRECEQTKVQDHYLIMQYYYISPPVCSYDVSVELASLRGSLSSTRPGTRPLNTTQGLTSRSPKGARERGKKPQKRRKVNYKNSIP